MSDPIASIGQSKLPALGRTGNAAPDHAPDPQTARKTDQVDLSVRAQLLNKLSQMPDVRQNLIDQVKVQIEAGVYETPEKIDAVLEEFMQDLA